MDKNIVPIRGKEEQLEREILDCINRHEDLTIYQIVGCLTFLSVHIITDPYDFYDKLKADLDKQAAEDEGRDPPQAELELEAKEAPKC